MTFSTEIAENLRVSRKFSLFRFSVSQQIKNIWKLSSLFHRRSLPQRRNFKWINQLIYIESDFAVCRQLGDKLERGGTQRGWWNVENANCAETKASMCFAVLWSGFLKFLFMWTYVELFIWSFIDVWSNLIDAKLCAISQHQKISMEIPKPFRLKFLPN